MRVHNEEVGEGRFHTMTSANVLTLEKTTHVSEVGPVEDEHAQE